MSQFKGWKKVHAAKDHSVMRNDEGHELRIAHAALSPKLRGQLAEIPVHSEETNPAGKKTTEKNKGQIKMSEGGKAWSQKDKEDFAKGASTAGTMKGDQKDSYEDPAPSKPKGYDEGGFVRGKPGAPDSTRRYVEPAKIAPQAPEDKNFLTQDARKAGPAFADGGEVPNPDEMIPGVPMQASNPNQYDFEQKKAMISQSDMNYPTPQAQDMAVTSKALDQLDNEKMAGAQAAAKVGAENGAAYQQALDLNKRLQAAGLPPKPLPGAPPPPPADDAGMNAQPEGGVTQPQQPGAQPAADDIFGTQTTQDAYMKGLGEQKQGIAGEARAIGAQGKVDAEIAHNAAVEKANLLDTYKNEQGALNKQRGEFMEALKNQKIDPNHYMGSMSTGDRISSAIGLILGGMGAGLTGGENPALKMLNMNIDRDIKAQEANLGTQKSLLEFNTSQFGNLRDGTTMTRVMMNDVASDKLKESAARSADPLAKSRALQAAGQLDTQSAAMLGQYAMRKAMLNGVANGKVSPASMVEFAIPQESRPAARKELKEMQDASQLRDHTLTAFDQVAKLNTIGNRIGSPLQSKRQIDAILGPTLDKLTKDTSGRVTPETVKLIEGIFSKTGNSPETQMRARAALNNLLTQGMNYPTLEAYHIGPKAMGRFNQAGESNIKHLPVVAPPRK